MSTSYHQNSPYKGYGTKCIINSLRILQLNIEGKTEIDVIVLQETHTEKDTDLFLYVEASKDIRSPIT